MLIKRIPLGVLDANGYVLCDESTKIGAVVDPGGYDERLENAIEQAGVRELKFILCTHGHFDHISGARLLKASHPEAQIGIGKNDAVMLGDGVKNLAFGFGMSFDPCSENLRFSAGDKIEMGETTLTVYSTPGHTPGGVIYVSEKDGVIFSGDTLFCGSIGRTDFPGSDYGDMLQSLELFKKFPEEYKVYSGHGPETTIGYELRNNMYLR